MTQRTDRFGVSIKWKNPEGSDAKLELSKFIRNSLDAIRTKANACGMEWFYTDRLLNHTASRLDVVFKLKPNTHSIEGRLDYNHFIEAVHALDNLLTLIPAELNPVGTYSTTDYKAPWVQCTNERANGFLVRKGATVFELNKKAVERFPINIGFSGEVDPIKAVKIIGEPTEVNKIVATLRQLLKRREITVKEIVDYISVNHRNTRWIILLLSEQNLCYISGYAVAVRKPVSLLTLTSRKYEDLLVNLKPKYPDTKIFGTDMFVLHV